MALVVGVEDAKRLLVGAAGGTGIAGGIVRAAELEGGQAEARIDVEGPAQVAAAALGSPRPSSASPRTK